MKIVRCSTIALLAAVLTIAVSACQSCDQPQLTGQPCDVESDCDDGFSCIEEVCTDEAADVGANDIGTSDEDIADTDEDGEDSCGESQSSCGDSCCDEGEFCDQGSCSAVCAGQVCGEQSELCCDGQEICFGDGCVIPGAECERTEECGLEEICEPSLGQCLPRDQIAVCEFRPPIGEFEPEVGCTWVPDGLMNPNRGDIVATPLVANLTDDNGDGLTNTDDIPNIVFPSFNRVNQGCCNVPSTLRILHGECSADGTMETIASINEPPINNDSGMALADLDNSGVPEIIGVTNNADGRPEGTVAFRRVSDDGTQWEVMWHNEEYPVWNVHSRGGATASVADLDGDGNPEVIIGNVVLNGQTGHLLWDGFETSQGDGGIGNNAFLGPAGTVADITLDGFQEVIAGNTVYDHEGQVLWTYDYTSNNSTCQGQLSCDGFNAVASITGEPHPNVIIIRRGEVFVLDYQGELVWKVDVPFGGCDRGNESGPPTVADFNGDGFREIGTAGADFYAVLKRECDVDDWEALGCDSRGVLWKTPNNDCSSRATASSLFDFDGSGRAEVVYADENTFQIYDGTTGALLFEDDSHQSNTRIEMPVIADVNNDGSAEVLVGSAYGNRGDRPGLRVWNDAFGNWVRTRRIWNQHAYYVTNINEDGSVPAQPERNWENPRLNNFRQNVQPDGLFDAPNLNLQAAILNEITCGTERELRITITVANEGAISVPAGIPVDVEIRTGASTYQLDRVFTADRLFPGTTEDFEFIWELPASLIGNSLEIYATVDSDNIVNECDEDDNEVHLTDIVCDVPG